MRTAMRSVTTVEQAMALQTHSLAMMRRDIGSTKLEALIKVHLIELNELLNLKRPLNEPQMDEIAAEVVATHYNLTMADVCLIMKRAKTGHYGEFYESLNMPKVMRWFADYFEERCTAAARQSLDAAAQEKEWTDPNRSKDTEREAFDQARALYLEEKGRNRG